MLLIDRTLTRSWNIFLESSVKLGGSDQTDQSALGFDLVDLEDLIEGQVFIYLDREDKDEKTVERSPELSVGNGGELDLLEMEKSKNPKISKIETHSSAEGVPHFWQTPLYLVSGDGIGDIEAGVPETGDKGVDAEMGQQFLDIIDILILKHHNVLNIPILK